MIYLSKEKQTEVITDNIVNFIPLQFDVYLDDVLIGEFENLSKSVNYLVFVIPAMKLEEREYIMSLYNHKALIKKELVIVKDSREFKVKSITKTKHITMYEK